MKISNGYDKSLKFEALLCLMSWLKLHHNSLVIPDSDIKFILQYLREIARLGKLLKEK